MATTEFQSVSDLVENLSSLNPGYEDLVFTLCNLLASYAPPYIYINTPTSNRVIPGVVKQVLSGVSSIGKVCHARVDAVACFTSRLLYDSILNSLAGWKPTWENGYQNWNGVEEGTRWNESFDSFLHGLKGVADEVEQAAKNKGKGKERLHNEAHDLKIVIVIERAERLKETMPDIIVPLTRLAELARLELSVIFISNVHWEDIRPSLGASPDPFYIDVSIPSKEAIIKSLTSSYNSIGSSIASSSGTNTYQDIYQPALLPLYSHFISTLYSICSQFTQDADELAYIAAARWPGFVQPILDRHKPKINIAGADDNENGLPELAAPSEDVRIRLTRLFTPSMKVAVDVLYPRLENATDWAAQNKPEGDILSKRPADLTLLSEGKPGRSDNAGLNALPRMSKFILVAAFLASTNPAKSDLRMFGRGLDEKKRKRRARKTTSTKSGPSKVPQRLLGPAPFPIDRLDAILGSLLEENDVDKRPPAPEFTIPGEYTDMEIARVGIYTSIVQLTSMGLLYRTSSPDNLDGPPMLKCGVSYGVALALAKELEIPLNDLLWDTL